MSGETARRIAVDLRPLRVHREFRLLWTGQFVTRIGSEVTYVALTWQAYQLTGSTLVVGLLSVAVFVPLVVTALLGGAVADARERRRTVLAAEAGLLLLSALLLANSVTGDPRVWVLFAVMAGVAVADGLERPSLDAMMPRLVPLSDVNAANALWSAQGTIGMIGGPALAGLLIAVGGTGLAYAFDVVTFAVSLACLALMRATPVPEDAARPSLRRIGEGFRYAASRPELLGTYVADIVALALAFPDALFPAVATRLGGPQTLGLLYAAPAMGAFLVTVTSGWTGPVRRHGLVILLACAGNGVAIAAFGLTSTWLVPALVALAAYGVCDMISGLFRMRIWNETIPDALRGRLAGIEMLGYSTGPLLGNVRGGWAGTRWGAGAAATVGGVACVVGVGIVAAALPGFVRYDAVEWRAQHPDLLPG